MAAASPIATLAHALLAALTTTEDTRCVAPLDGLIALTLHCNEVHRLFDRLILEPARRLANPLTRAYRSAPATINAYSKHDQDRGLEY